MELKIDFKFNLKKKIIFSLITLFIVIFFIVYLIVIPTVLDIKKMGNEIEAQRIDLEKKYIKGQNLKQLAENLKKIEPQLDKLDKIFINHNRELEFITTLEEIAQTNEITQKINLSTDQASESQKFKKMPLQLYAKGNFINLVNYLLSLENLYYYINIKSIELFPGSNNLEDINLLITADTFYQ